MNLFLLVSSATGDIIRQNAHRLDNSGGATFGQIFAQVANTLLYVIGAVAVIMIIFGGFKFVTSAGDAKSVEAAKNTVSYAVIGLIVAILSLAIIHFVTARL